MCEFSLFGNHFSNASQKQYCPAAQVVVNTPTSTHCLLTLLASLDAMSVLLHKDVCPYMCVWVRVGVYGGEMDAGEQLARANSSAGQSRASLDSHAR